MTGKEEILRYPAPLLLNGQALPWVKSAAHLAQVFLKGTF